ncbi:ChrR family anti-sigma-E factor [Oricola thermophila]|uniref:Cupin domain-containing protein n=1 Tax=Oricola thermophila TaxID=2742145 RepID=A0A6N1VA86_9HYPH|nr:ChrR family anti-sigma-E factor [Oricola thermophila]QKV17453.1 cupin domain-containing protein [Oricola thermophila]
MSIAHHLDEATLVRYASGDLDEAFLVVVATHLAMCDRCRKAAHDAEELGGEMLFACEPADLGANALSSLWNRIEGAGGQADIARPAAKRSSRRVGDLPPPLNRKIGGRLDAIPWRRIAPGVKKHVIRTDTATSSALYMLWVAPGVAVPEHGHGGSEMTLILSGAYRDELGLFGPGDIADLDEHVEHQPCVEGDEPCICLVATDTPLRFAGLLGRLLQPFIGI